MARHTLSIIDLLRSTAKELEGCSDYQWGHMGSCNCGFLARKITGLTKDKIHAYAMQGSGNWSEQLTDYCPGSGLPMDELISEMIAFGFDSEDLHHLEHLSDRTILNVMPEGKKYPVRHLKADVILYLEAWANLLESRLLEEIRLPVHELSPVEG